MSNIFRQTALDKISSPEQLDRPLRLTSARTFLGVIFSLIVITAVLTWSIAGSIPTKYYGQGVIMSNGGVEYIESYESVILSDVSIEKGDEIEVGEIVARIDKNHLIAEIESLEMMAEHSRNSDEIIQINLEIDKLKKELTDNKIVSAVKGKVMDVYMKKNYTFAQAENLYSVIRKGDNINNSTVIFYLPVEQGKALVAGMDVNVYPSIYSRHEYGHMKAVITKVSEYTVSKGDILNAIGSIELADKFMQKGALVQVEAILQQDSSTKSGYYWSGNKGKNIKVEEGTLCDVSITIKNQKPISLLFPNIQ